MCVEGGGVVELGYFQPGAADLGTHTINCTTVVHHLLRVSTEKVHRVAGHLGNSCLDEKLKCFCLQGNMAAVAGIN